MLGTRSLQFPCETQEHSMSHPAAHWHQVPLHLLKLFSQSPSMLAEASPGPLPIECYSALWAYLSDQ